MQRQGARGRKLNCKKMGTRLWRYSFTWLIVQQLIFFLTVLWVAWVIPPISPSIVHWAVPIWRTGWGPGSAEAVGHGTLIFTAGSLSLCCLQYGGLKATFLEGGFQLWNLLHETLRFTSLLSHFMGQSKSRSQPRFKRRENRHYVLRREVAESHCEKLVGWGILMPSFWGTIYYTSPPNSSHSSHMQNTLVATFLHGLFLSHKKEWNRDFPGGAVVKNPPANAGDTGSSPGPGRSHMPRSN